MSSYERLKSSNSMHMWRKFVRLMQLNSRFCMIFILTVTFLIAFNSIPTRRQKFHKYILNILGDSCRGGASNIRYLDESHNHHRHHKNEDYEIVWSNETIELFKDQLGLTFNVDDYDDDNVDGRTIKCRSGEFLISALPGPDEENFAEVLWQFFSLDALEQMTIQCDVEKRLSLKAVYTERMTLHLNQIFDGLPLETITNFPSSCYNLKYTKIIGNISPIELNKIAPNTPFLLDPKIKRWMEISMRFLKKKPMLRMNPDVLRKVQKELEMARKISNIRTSHDESDFNFIGVYIANEDKLPLDYYQKAIKFLERNSTRRNIFMVICDPLNLIFCRDTIERQRNSTVSVVHLIRKSTDAFDFVLMSSCNSTLISNDISVLHALINGGTTVVYKPPSKNDPQFYVPWVMSENMDNWHSIGSNV